MKMGRKSNCYNCGRFGYIEKHYKNWELVPKEKRMKYKDNHIMDNSKEEENLVILD